MKRWHRKKGSVLMLILILSMTTLLILMSISNLLVSTYKNHEKYNINDNIDLASRSALNIGKSEILKYIDENNGKILSVDELKETYDLTDNVTKIIGKDEFNYEVKATLDVSVKVLVPFINLKNILKYPGMAI